MLAAILALVVGTWNGNWFPSGRAEHRAHPEVEAATIAAAGKMLSDGLAAADPSGAEGVVIVLNEIRNREVAEALAAIIGRPGLKLASISAYRRRDRFDQQQDAILTTLPVADSGWGRWQRGRESNPPRGYAFAAVVVSPAVTAQVYAVHLKSNYGATTKALADENRAKRTDAIDQFIALAKGAPRVVLAGDFNADKWRGEFAAETIFSSLDAAGYANLISLMPPNGRGTHPNRRYGDSALDYIMAKGMTAVGAPSLVPNAGLSDHFAVFARLEPAPVAAVRGGGSAAPVSSQRRSSPKPRRKGRRPAGSRDSQRAPSRTP